MKCLKEYMARPVRPLALARSHLCALSASLPLFQLAVRWLEHSCHYQYLDELLQYIRFGLMDVDTLHTVALSMAPSTKCSRQFFMGAISAQELLRGS